MLRAAKTVRLKQHQQAVELAAAGGFERGLDLRGMMAVVIDDGDVVDRTFDVETAADSGKVLQTPANQFGGNVEIEGDGGCGGGVAHVVNARRMRQAEKAEVVAFVGQAELARQTLKLNIADKQVGLARGAIGKNWPLDVRNDGLNVGLIQAEDGRAIEGNAVHELGEGVLDVGERRVLVEVFPIDRGDDGHHRRKEEKAAVAFVRLHNKVFAFPKPGGGAGLIHLAANHKGRIEMSCGEDGSDERGSRGLAVRSADGDAVFQPHQFGQHLRARDDRDLALVRFRYFGVVGSDRRRRDHDVRALDVCRFVAFVNGGTQVLETLGERGRLGVRAGDGVAESKQNFGDAAHTDAADAHQVYALKIPERNHHENFPLPLACVLFPCTPATSSTMLTMSRAASGRASPRAFAASCRICPGSSSSPKISPVRRSAVSSFSIMTLPAPALAISCALRSWWLSVARPNGMKIAARPDAATSEAVMAPVRQTIKSAQAKRSAMLSRNGTTSAE